MSDVLRFITKSDVQVEELPWGPHEWISREGFDRGGSFVAGAGDDAAGQGARISSPSVYGRDYLCGCGNGGTVGG